MNKKSLIATVLIGVSLTSGASALAQDQVSSDEVIKLLRKDLRSLKKQIVAANMDLTDTEAQTVLAGLRSVHNGTGQDS
jgi:hypothetical protein